MQRGVELVRLRVEKCGRRPARPRRILVHMSHGNVHHLNERFTVVPVVGREGCGPTGQCDKKKESKPQGINDKRPKQKKNEKTERKKKTCNNQSFFNAPSPPQKKTKTHTHTKHTKHTADIPITTIPCGREEERGGGEQRERNILTLYIMLRVSHVFQTARTDQQPRDINSTTTRHDTTNNAAIRASKNAAPCARCCDQTTPAPRRRCCFDRVPGPVHPRLPLPSPWPTRITPS